MSNSRFQKYYTALEEADKQKQQANNNADKARSEAIEQANKDLIARMCEMVGIPKDHPKAEMLFEMAANFVRGYDLDCEIPSTYRHSDIGDIYEKFRLLARLVQ